MTILHEINESYLTEVGNLLHESFNGMGDISTLVLTFYAAPRSIFIKNVKKAIKSAKVSHPLGVEIPEVEDILRHTLSTDHTYFNVYRGSFTFSMMEPWTFAIESTAGGNPIRYGAGRTSKLDKRKKPIIGCHRHHKLIVRSNKISVRGCSCCILSDELAKFPNLDRSQEYNPRLRTYNFLSHRYVEQKV